MLKLPPAAIATTLVSPTTCPGVTRASPPAPSPTWRELFNPQPHTVPSLFNASVWCCPAEAAMAITLVRLLTCTGTLLLVSVPSPS